MTLLAEGTLSVNRTTVDSISVARQAASLSSSSPTNAQTQSVKLAQEAEGKAFAVEQEDTANLVSGLQAQEAEATQQPDETSAGTAPKGEGVVDEPVSRESLEATREQERERMEAITKELNAKLNEQLALRFRTDEDTGVDLFQLVEKESGEVVRQVPSEEILEFMKKFQSFSGLFLSQQA